jgi:hypothetical protein
MSETNQAPDDNRALVRVLQEISEKLSVLEEIKMSVNRLERYVDRERLDRQETRRESSALIAVDDTTRPRSRGKGVEEPADTADSDPDSRAKVVTQRLLRFEYC